MTWKRRLLLVWHSLGVLRPTVHSSIPHRGLIYIYTEQLRLRHESFSLPSITNIARYEDHATQAEHCDSEALVRHDT